MTIAQLFDNNNNSFRFQTNITLKTYGKKCTSEREKEKKWQQQTLFEYVCVFCSLYKVEKLNTITSAHSSWVVYKKSVALWKQEVKKRKSWKLISKAIRQGHRNATNIHYNVYGTETEQNIIKKIHVWTIEIQY